MKIDIKIDDQVESSGVEVSLMSLDTAKYAKLFHMLSNTLYSDKPGSVTRELASNAYDSHLMADKLHVPFIITAPTFEDPTFQIRDFGVGLSADEAEDTILCYLGSTKDDSEKCIGGWGVGSKSPFSYTTTYEVLVFKDGKKTHFTCWKDETGLPQKAILDQCDTEEPNGVLMRFPVKSEDILVFASSLRSYMRWTNYNVELHEGEQIMLPRVPTAEKDFGTFKVKVFPGGKGERKLVYGGFSYDMTSCVDNRYDYAGYWHKTQQKLRYGYDVAFVIDTPNLVTFAMNREVLEQTERSRNFVMDMVNKFGAIADAKHEIVNKMSEEFFSKSNHAKSLAEIDAFIEELNQKISEQDTSFDTVFVSSSSKITFEFSTLSKLTERGVYPLRRVEIEPKETKEQFMLSYGRLSRPGPSARRDFIYNLEHKKTVFYVKANSKEEAISLFSGAPELTGYDLSSLEIEEVIIPKKVRSHSDHVRGPRVSPVPYCREAKKRMSWKESRIYVVCDKLPQETENKSIPLQFLLAQENVFFLVPTPLFLEETEDKENVIDFADLEEHAKTYLFDTLSNKYSSELDSKVRSFKRYLTRLGGVIKPSTVGNNCYDTFRDIVDAADGYSVSYISTSEQSEVNTYVKKKLSDLSWLNALKKRLSRVIMEEKRLKEVSKYVRLSSIDDGSALANDILKMLNERGYNV
jgi:hypothetical protein